MLGGLSKFKKQSIIYVVRNRNLKSFQATLLYIATVGSLSESVYFLFLLNFALLESLSRLQNIQHCVKKLFSSDEV